MSRMNQRGRLDRYHGYRHDGCSKQGEHDTVHTTWTKHLHPELNDPLSLKKVPELWPPVQWYCAAWGSETCEEIRDAQFGRFLTARRGSHVAINEGSRQRPGLPRTGRSAPGTAEHRWPQASRSLPSPPTWSRTRLLGSHTTGCILGATEGGVSSSKVPYRQLPNVASQAKQLQLILILLPGWRSPIRPGLSRLQRTNLP